MRSVTSGVAVFAAGLVALGAAAWRAAAVPAERPLSGDARTSASETLRLFLALSTHLRGSGGDPRYAERIPAGPELVAEMMAEVSEAARLGTRDAPRLVGLEVRSAKALGSDAAELRTREYWITTEKGETGGSARSDVVNARYLMRRLGTGWRVDDWELDDGVADAAAPGAR